MINDLKRELNKELITTENGALGFRTSGKELLDLHFKTSSLRNATNEQICKLFVKAYYEDKLTALKWLFYLRDVRGGLGERRSFRVIFEYLAYNETEIAKRLIDLVPEYGRWDDLFILINTPLEQIMLQHCYVQFINDIDNVSKGKSISLLAKYLPSPYYAKYKKKAIKYNSEELYKKYEQKKNFCSKFMTEFHLNRKSYAKTLSRLREYLNVVEKQMSANEWDKINYSIVPSKANLIYDQAFITHDTDRRLEFLALLKSGKAKINSKTLFPYEIVDKYGRDNYNETYEQLWKHLPNYVNGESNTLVVADGSGSMYMYIGISNNSVMAIDVANSLAIYFAERCDGEYKDKYITFSSRPQLVDLSKGKSLKEKLDICYKYSEVANTNIKAVFELVLKVAIKNKYTQEQIPNILVISDMEFDDGARYDKALFEEIKDEFAEYGYNLPRLVFWNTCGRTNAIPLTQNDLGVILLSGFSPAVVNMALTGDLDPYKALLKMLNSDRYKAIETALFGINL